ncbi:MAG: hypothetical protein AB7K86_24765 [Rhodospirillales bacterium]
MRRLQKLALATGSLVPALLMVGCAASPPPPQATETTKPGITYTYHTDADLVTVSRNAEAYCRQYNAGPRTRGIVDNPSGNGKSVRFDCDVPMVASVSAVPGPVATVPVPASPPNVSYVYRTDAELIQAVRNADVYCRRFNATSRPATTTMNADGSRTAVFDCGPL